MDLELRKFAKYVDKTFITEGEEGFRLAKVRFRDESVPSIGYKVCSRCKI